LRRWEREHGRLTPELRAKFLERPEPAVLTSLPDRCALSALIVHKKLAPVLEHATWVNAGRPRGAQRCGCPDDDGAADEHHLSVGPGPDTGVRRTGLSSPTVVGKCTCGWCRRGGSESMVRVLWIGHRDADEVP
jgi:hypothetical protein